MIMVIYLLRIIYLPRSKGSGGHVEHAPQEPFPNLERFGSQVRPPVKRPGKEPSKKAARPVIFKCLHFEKGTLTRGKSAFIQYF